MAKESRKFNPTLEQCKDAAVMVGLKEEEGERFYIQYKPQGWVWGNHVPMTEPLQVCLQRWKRKGQEMKAKRDLPPALRQKCERCKKKQARFIDESGAYTHYYCEDCIK